MISGTCYEIDADEIDNQRSSVESLFSFDKDLKYYQKPIPGNHPPKMKNPGNHPQKMKSGAAIMGHGLTWGQRQGVFVFGSPNFNLGLPKTGARFGGFGNILRYGKFENDKEASRITKNDRVLNNPTKGRGEGKGFRVKLKEEAGNIRKQNGEPGNTPGLYLGWTVITGK